MKLKETVFKVYEKNIEHYETCLNNFVQSRLPIV